MHSLQHALDGVWQNHCPEHDAFKNCDENHTVPIGLWKWDPFKSQLGIWNFPKETNEEGNGSPVQPAQLAGCKHAGSGVRAAVCWDTAQPLVTSTESYHAQQPACTNTNPPVARMMHPKAAAPSAEPVAYPQLQHQWQQEDAALQSQPVSFPSSENQRMEKANKPWRDFLFL